MDDKPLEPLQLVLVDDEELARIRLRGLVHDCLEPAARVVFEAANAAQALAWLVEHVCDAVLLDVQMPGRDGTQLAAELSRLPRAAGLAPAVVFVTAHAQHALRAFDLEAVDYLTKPVRRERLQAALQRVERRKALHRAVPAAMAAGDKNEQPVIIVSDRGRIVRVPLGEVLYLKAELKYVTLRTAQHTYVVDEALSELETRLGHRFLRVHRNALVSRRAVRALERRGIAAGERGNGSGNGDAGGVDEGTGWVAGGSGGGRVGVGRGHLGGGIGAPAGDDDVLEGWAVRVAPVDEWLAVSRRQLSAVREALIAAGR